MQNSPVILSFNHKEFSKVNKNLEFFLLHFPIVHSCTSFIVFYILIFYFLKKSEKLKCLFMNLCVFLEVLQFGIMDFKSAS